MTSHIASTTGLFVSPDIVAQHCAQCDTKHHPAIIRHENEPVEKRGRKNRVVQS